MRLSWKNIGKGITYLVMLCLLAAVGCQSEKGAGGPEIAPVRTITRQDFYKELYDRIRGDAILRSIYIPCDTVLEQGESSSFTQKLCGNPLQGGSDFQSQMSALKMQSASCMALQTRKYQQSGAGGELQETRYIWRFPGSSGKLWEDLIADFAEVSPQNQEAVLFCCESGLAAIYEDPENFELKLCPDEPVENSEIETMNEYIQSHRRPAPLHGIETHDTDGNKIFLCFSDAKTLLPIKRTMQYLQQNQDIENSFLYFDSAGVQVSLWISSLSSGMLTIPLDFGKGAVLEFPVQTDNPELMLNKFKIAAAALPQKLEEQFLSDVRSAMQSDLSSDKFHYWITQGYSMELSYADSGESLGKIQVKIMSGGY